MLTNRLRFVAGLRARAMRACMLLLFALTFVSVKGSADNTATKLGGWRGPNKTKNHSLFEGLLWLAISVMAIGAIFIFLKADFEFVGDQFDEASKNILQSVMIGLCVSTTFYGFSRMWTQKKIYNAKKVYENAGDEEYDNQMYAATYERATLLQSKSNVVFLILLVVGFLMLFGVGWTLPGGAGQEVGDDFMFGQTGFMFALLTVFSATVAMSYANKDSLMKARSSIKKALFTPTIEMPEKKSDEASDAASARPDLSRAKTGTTVYTNTDVTKAKGSFWKTADGWPKKSTWIAAILVMIIICFVVSGVVTGDFILGGEKGGPAYMKEELGMKVLNGNVSFMLSIAAILGSSVILGGMGLTALGRHTTYQKVASEEEWNNMNDREKVGGKWFSYVMPLTFLIVIAMAITMMVFGLKFEEGLLFQKSGGMFVWAIYSLCFVGVIGLGHSVKDLDLDIFRTPTDAQDRIPPATSMTLSNQDSVISKNSTQADKGASLDDADNSADSQKGKKSRRRLGLADILARL